VRVPETKLLAEKHGIPVFQPEKLRSGEFPAKFASLRPDIAFVAAYGKILPKQILETPRHGCVNIHASLLPKYRGAAPIQGAIADGQKKTGVTIMQMVEELDAGPILSQEDTPIDAWETAGELSQRLADLGAGLLVETVDQMAKAKGKLKTKAQKEEQATYAARLTKREAKVNWALNAQELFNRLRAQSPWPGLSTRFQGHSVKLVWGVPIVWEEVPLGTSGTYLGMRQGRLAVLCGQNSIFGIERLQRAGKKAVSAADYANGVRLSVGERFI
jgi:methionyl-tRNA formyltransferase